MRVVTVLLLALAALLLPLPARAAVTVTAVNETCTAFQVVGSSDQAVIVLAVLVAGDVLVWQEYTVSATDFDVTLSFAALPDGEVTYSAFGVVGSAFASYVDALAAYDGAARYDNSVIVSCSVPTPTPAPTATPMQGWFDVIDATPAVLDEYPVLSAALIFVAAVAAAAFAWSRIIQVVEK